MTLGPWTYLAEVNRYNEKAPIGIDFVYIREEDGSKTVVSGDIRSLGDLQLIANAFTFFASLRKKFETRSWATKYRGELAIHASKKVNKDICNHEPFKIRFGKMEL